LQILHLRGYHAGVRNLAVESNAYGVTLDVLIDGGAYILAQ
jgi:hypothetical protein